VGTDHRSSHSLPGHERVLLICGACSKEFTGNSRHFWSIGRFLTKAAASLFSVNSNYKQFRGVEDGEHGSKVSVNCFTGHPGSFTFRVSAPLWRMLRRLINMAETVKRLKISPPLIGTHK